MSDTQNITAKEVVNYFITSLMRSFTFAHLRPHLQEVSRPFCELAEAIAARAPDDPETLEALRALVRAKDCAVRAANNAPRST